MSEQLEIVCPELAKRLPRICLADLPTPVIVRTLNTSAGRRDVTIKCDDASGKLYGGNKVRKLEYL